MMPRNPSPTVVAAAVLATLAVACAGVEAHAADALDGLWSKSDAGGDAPPGAGAEATPSATAETDTPAAANTPSVEKTDNKNGKKPDKTSGRSGLFNYRKPGEATDLLGHSLAAVLVILVLGAAAIVVVKRLLPRLGISQGRRVSVLETVYLGPRKSLYVVQVGERTLLVSGTREQLSLLADVTGSLPPEEGNGPAPLAVAPSSGKRFRVPGLELENS